MHNAIQTKAIETTQRPHGFVGGLMGMMGFTSFAVVAILLFASNVSGTVLSKDASLSLADSGVSTPHEVLHEPSHPRFGAWNF